MKIDVIIPVYRPGERFEELLRRLKAQTVPIHRIIVMNTEQKYWDAWLAGKAADDGKTADGGEAAHGGKAADGGEAAHSGKAADGEEARRGSDGSDGNGGVQADGARPPRLPENLSVFHVTREEFDHGATRDAAIRKSDADICICMTHDALPAGRDLVRRLCLALTDHPEAAAAYARQLPNRDCGVIERYTRSFNYPPESRVKTKADLPELGIKTYFCSNVCAAYRRDVYLKLGGFTRKTIFNEDMIYAAKAMEAGYSVVYAADARVLHSHHYSGAEQLRRNFDLAVSQADHPEVFAGVRSEGEGLRLVRQTAAYLVKSGHAGLLAGLVWQSGCKYLGYRLGKNYRRLPRKLVRRLTMNSGYWKG